MTEYETAEFWNGMQIDPNLAESIANLPELGEAHKQRINQLFGDKS